MTEPLTRDQAGFRLRGLATTRIETFTDAAFAFALTLLVISLDPPTSFDSLRQAMAGIPAFILSASMLMMFWWGHHEWSRRYGLDDLWTLVLSCGLVFTVLVYVYPLRFMFGLMMSWIGEMSGLPIGGGIRIGEPADVSRMFVIYGIGFATMSSAMLALNLHAWRRRMVLELDAVEVHETLSTIGAWSILSMAGLLSMLVGLISPPTMLGLPGWVYALLGPGMPLYGRLMRRRRLQLDSAAEEGVVAVGGAR